MLDQVIKEIPQLQITQKIGAFVLEALMGPVCGFLPLERTVSRVLHTQGRGDDKHLAQAVFLLPCQDHAGNPGIDGKSGQPPADAGKGIVVIHGAEFSQ